MLISENNINENTYMEMFDGLVNRDIYYFPYRDHLISMDFYVNGIFQKIYWLRENLNMTEEFIWLRRKKVTPDMIRMVFVDNIYYLNTLIRNYKCFASDRCVEILNELIFARDREVIISSIVKNNVKWIQISIECFELLLEFISIEELKDSGIVYVELITDDFFEQKIENNYYDENFMISIVGFMPLVGFYMFDGERNGDIYSVEVIDDGIEISSKVNKAVDICHYTISNYIHNRRHIRNKQCFIIEKQLQSVIEYINETMGKIVISEHVEYDDLENKIAITVKIHNSYKGWSEKVKSLIINKLTLDIIEVEWDLIVRCGEN